MKSELLIAVGAVLLTACASDNGGVPRPREIIDLGALVTEDLPERVWGKAFMSQMGFHRNNSFEVIHWEAEFADGVVSGSNSYYTLFNHGGPHVDAPRGCPSRC